jgi:hypothetical protein
LYATDPACLLFRQFNEGVEVRDHSTCTILPPPPRPWDFSQWHHWILIDQHLLNELNKGVVVSDNTENYQEHVP